MRSKLFVVTGGMFGSEGKGAVAGRLARDLSERGRSVAGVRVGGPNAGHTVYGMCPKGCSDAHSKVVGGDRGGWHPWRLRQVPVSAVTAPESVLVVAQGSEIDPAVLLWEVAELDSAGYHASSRIVVDGSATVIDGEHILQEQSTGLNDRVGSTAKGIGAARADRIWRRAGLWRDHAESAFLGFDDTAGRLAGYLRSPDGAVVVEGTQGFGLGLHAGWYPFATSGDCRAVDFLAQAGISSWNAGELHVLVCMRPYPIRVAGNSGPLKDETTWEDLGLSAELTTVTRKVRRVGAWDPVLAARAMVANGAPSDRVHLALTMADQVVPGLADVDGETDTYRDMRSLVEAAAPSPGPYNLLESYRSDCLDARLAYVGTGPAGALVDAEAMYS